MACHTTDGSRGSPANPILQGQHPDYLAKQLAEFKAGKRNNPDHARLRFGAQPAGHEERGGLLRDQAGQARVREEQGHGPALGESIYRGGIADRNVPACAGCHSPSGAGIPAQYPRLAGQHADYAEAQLVAFRSGARANSAQMTGVAAKLNDREIKALADYIAGLR